MLSSNSSLMWSDVFNTTNTWPGSTAAHNLGVNKNPAAQYSTGPLADKSVTVTKVTW